MQHESEFPVFPNLAAQARISAERRRKTCNPRLADVFVDFPGENRDMEGMPPPRRLF
jgi:hypothetical protein